MSGNMPSSIKITALGDIGNAISYTTLFPVVSMQGTPTTDRANLQIIGNIILSTAGGSYFPPAAQALLAQTVTNAAQPNITSVGTLTGLSVLANINAGNVNGGNIINANFYYGDAGHLANINVANVSGLGNVATINLDGNVSNVLSGAGTWVPMTGGGGSSYIIYNGNSNVSIPYTDGSTVITANSGIAHRWVFDDQGNLTLPSNTFAVNYANGDQVPLGGGGNGTPGGNTTEIQFNSNGAFAGSDSFTFDGGNLTVTGANFIANPGSYILQVYGANAYMGSLTDGGILVESATTTINTSNTVINGVLVAQASDNGSIVFSDNGTDNNGSLKVDGGLNMTLSANSNFYVKQAGQDRLAITDGNTDLMASTNVVIHSNKAGTENKWIFDSSGNLSLPGSANYQVPGLGSNGHFDINSWYPVNISTGDGVNDAVSTWNFGYNGTLSFPNNFASIYTDTGANQLNIGAGGDGGGYVTINATTDTGIGGSQNVFIQSNFSGNGYIWKFDDTGNLALPRGGVIYETNIPFDGLAGNTISLKPSGGLYANQELLVYPTVGGDNNHLHLTSGNLYDTELFLGNDDLFVKLANTGNIQINANDGNGNVSLWNYEPGGSLTLPANRGFVGLDGYVNGLDLWNENPTVGYVKMSYQGNSSMSVDTNGANITSNNFSWVFDPTGNLTLPGNSFAINYANGSQVVIGGGSSNTIQDGPSLAYIDGVGGNFVISISDSDSVWSFGVGGDITFPGGSVQHGAYGGPDFPSVSSNSGKYLYTDGTQLLWQTVSGGSYGNITGANAVVANYFYGDGSHLTNVTSALSVYDFVAQTGNPGVSDTYNAPNTSQFITVDSNGGFTAYVVLPAAPANGSQYTIKKASTFGSPDVSVSAASGKTIDGSASAIQFNNAWGYITVVYDSTYDAYFIIAQNTTYTP